MKVNIFTVPGHPPFAGKFFRMARQTLTVIGYQTIRQWVMVECSKEGWVSQGTNIPPLPIGTLRGGEVVNQPAAEAKLLEHSIFISAGTIEG